MKPLSRAASRTISVIGAGVVLATFVVRDVMREGLKDLNDKLGDTESFYFSQVSKIFIEGDLNYLVQQTDLAKAANDANKTDAQRQQDEIMIRAESSRGLLQVVTEFADDLALVVGKVSTEQSRMTEVKKLSADCGAGIAKVDAFEKTFPAVFAAYTAAPKEPGTLQRLKEVLDQTRVIHDETAAIMKSVKPLALAVVVDLRDRMGRGETDYSRATVAFYVLFALGWATSLVGQLLGSDKSTEA